MFIKGHSFLICTELNFTQSKKAQKGVTNHPLVKATVSRIYMQYNCPTHIPVSNFMTRCPPYTPQLLYIYVNQNPGTEQLRKHHKNNKTRGKYKNL